jgi:hypothetical protein
VHRCRNRSTEPWEASAGFFGRGKEIVGRYIATASNEPCRDANARHGFTEEGGAWVHCGESAIEDLDWLTVDAETEAAA